MPTSLKATCVSGTGESYLVYDMGEDKNPIYLRFLFNPDTLANGTVAMIRGLNSSSVEKIKIEYNPATRVITATPAGLTALTATLIAGLTWFCIEFKIDGGVGGAAELWVNGVSQDTETADYTTIVVQTIRMGANSKESATTGDFYLDEIIMDASYSGIVVPTPSTSLSSLTEDPYRWIVIYNTATQDSIDWADGYRSARGLAYANLCGLSLPATESISNGQWVTMRDAVKAYIDDNGLTQIKGILLGHGCPGLVSGSPDRSVVSMLASLTDDTADLANAAYVANPSIPVASIADVADLPARSTLPAAGRFITAEIQASTKAEADALDDRADALFTTRVDLTKISALDPATDEVAISSSAWALLTSFDDSVQQQQIRLPKTSGGWDGTTHGQAVEFSEDTGNDMSVAGQTKALLVSGGASTADAIRSGTGLIKTAIATGGVYAFAIGYVGAPTSAQLLNPAALIAALRNGWTWAEALAVAAPVINSTWRAIGDPLGYCPMPLQGYNIIKRDIDGGADQLVMIKVAGSTTAVVTGMPSSSIKHFHVRAISPCGVIDVEPIRQKRVEFDGSGNIVLPAPNPPFGLTLHLGLAGKVIATWTYSAANQDVPPEVFDVYVAQDAAAFNFGAATATENYNAGKRAYSKDLGTFADLTLVKVVVRSKAAVAAGVEEGNHIMVQIRADDAAPDVPQSLEVSVS